MGDSGCVRSVSWSHRPALDLGPGTPGAFLHDFHAATMAKLAGKRSIHNRRLLRSAGFSFHRKLDRISITAKLVDVCGNPALDAHGGLHGVPVCPGEGARPLAKSAAATALVSAGVAAWIGSVVTNRGAGPRHAYHRHHQICAIRILLSALDTGGDERPASAGDMGRSVADSCDGARTRGDLGNDNRSIPKRVLDRSESVDSRRTLCGAGVLRINKRDLRRGGGPVGVGWHDALRTRVRAGRTVSAAGMSPVGNSVTGSVLFRSDSVLR